MNDNNIFYGTGGRTVSVWRRLLQRSVLIPLAALLIVGVGAWTFAAIRNSLLSDKKHNQTVLAAALRDATNARNEWDYQRAYDILKPVEKNAVTKEDKLRYYELMYLCASSTNRMAESLTYLEKRHEVDPSTAGADALLMAEDYERLGSKDKALEQYKVALQYQESLTGEKRYQERIDRIKEAISLLEKK